MNKQLFLTYAKEDSKFAELLSDTLSLHGIRTWNDSYQIRIGVNDQENVHERIKESWHLLIIFSIDSLANDRVVEDLNFASQYKDSASGDFRIIPIILPGINWGHVKRLFQGKHSTPVYVEELSELGLNKSLPQILALIRGIQIPSDEPSEKIIATPIEELFLKLSDPCFVSKEGKRYASAVAELSFRSSIDPEPIRGRRFRFESPIGPDELEEIRWYIEEYPHLPISAYRLRAAKVESNLREWGELLFASSIGFHINSSILNQWLSGKANLRLSIEVDADLIEGTDVNKMPTQREAASELLALPWETLSKENQFIAFGGKAVRTRRRFPSRRPRPHVSTALPIRVLFICPRPEIMENGSVVSFIDHLLSASALVQAVENLDSGMVKIDFLESHTLSGLHEALEMSRNNPYHVIHFDGHGTFDTKENLGALLFESDVDQNKVYKRRGELVNAKILAEVITDFGAPLIYLEACQSGKSSLDPMASVASQMLDNGINSVIAMAHTVLVETARRFAIPFYKNLAEGKRIGEAVHAGQLALKLAPHRAYVYGKSLKMQDWFVPILFQDASDPQLFTEKLALTGIAVNRERKKRRLGHLPPAPSHQFVGRRRELLHLERILRLGSFAVVKGGGGLGKTALTVEFANWMIRSFQFDQVVFVSVEPHLMQDAVGFLQLIGEQLIPGFLVTKFGGDLDSILHTIGNAITNRKVIMIIDNFESVLPSATEHPGFSELIIEGLDRILERIMDACIESKMVFTSREVLPTPFDNENNTLNMGRMLFHDAQKLVKNLLDQTSSKVRDIENDIETSIRNLVEAANCHPRALVLLVKESKGDLAVTLSNYSKILHAMESRLAGNRENSLYASLELSLQRLPRETREQIADLAIFKGGGHLADLAEVVGIDIDAMRKISQSLLDIGVAETVEYNFLIFDPAFSNYLSSCQTRSRLNELEIVWVKAMEEVVVFLVGQLAEDVKMARKLSALYLRNFFALIQYYGDSQVGEDRIGGRSLRYIMYIERLVALLDRPQRLMEIVNIREELADRGNTWNSISYEEKAIGIERSIQNGNFSHAVEEARELLEVASAFGPEKYPDADLDIAKAHWLLGRSLRRIGKFDDALEYLISAENEYRRLNQEETLNMFGILVDKASCLGDMYRLDESADLYRHLLTIKGASLNQRKRAILLQNLGITLQQQGKFGESNHRLLEALSIYQDIKEYRSIAVTQRVMGYNFLQTDEIKNSETFYREALRAYISLNDSAGIAVCSRFLGELYQNAHNRPEEALVFFEEAKRRFAEIDSLGELGVLHDVIARCHYQMRNDQLAKQEILEAIRIQIEIQDRNNIWRSYHTLHGIERAKGEKKASETAWVNARDNYFFYREMGGSPQSPFGHFCDRMAAKMPNIDGKGLVRLSEEFREAREKNGWSKDLCLEVLWIMDGRASDVNLNKYLTAFWDAAELLLLRKRLQLMNPS